MSSDSHMSMLPELLGRVILSSEMLSIARKLAQLSHENWAYKLMSSEAGELV